MHHASCESHISYSQKYFFSFCGETTQKNKHCGNPVLYTIISYVLYEILVYNISENVGLLIGLQFVYAWSTKSHYVRSICANMCHIFISLLYK